MTGIDPAILPERYRQSASWDGLMQPWVNPGRDDESVVCI
jgi:hypothetical protein